MLTKIRLSIKQKSGQTLQEFECRTKHSGTKHPMPFFATPDKTSRIDLPPRTKHPMQFLSPRSGENGMGCYVRGDKNSMGCYVRGDKNSMGCFVRGGKSLWDVLSGVSKNGMGCFVLGCFVRLPRILHSLNLVTVKSCSKGLICKMCNTCRCRSRLSGKEASMFKDLREGVCFADFISFLLNIL